MNYVTKENHIYCLDEHGNVIAEVLFPMVGSYIEINRTFVDPSLRGQGVANQLLELAYDTIKKQDIKVVPTCSYAVTWFKRYPDKRDILAPHIDLTNQSKTTCSI